LIEEVTECNRDVTLTIRRRLSQATAVVLGWMKSSGLNSSTMTRFLFSVYAIALVLSCTVEPWAQASQQNPQANDSMRVPGTEWERAKPESLGYSSARLEALRGWLKTQQTDAMMVVVHGKVIFEYGDLSLATKVASVRKSVLGMLYGNYVFSGKSDLDKTVKELGLEDRERFLPIEERATLEQLLTARSGIYLPSGNKDLDLDMPKRGSEYPGTRFVYNNWDFNAAGTAFEKLTGKDIYDAVESDIARPIAMQDYASLTPKENPDHLRSPGVPFRSFHTRHGPTRVAHAARRQLERQADYSWRLAIRQRSLHPSTTSIPLACTSLADRSGGETERCATSRNSGRVCSFTDTSLHT
jgi:CubicO group peptidase (beta-lactamase class C family)